MNSRFWTSSIVLLALVSVPALGQAKAEWELRVGDALAGPVVRGVAGVAGAAGDGAGATWLATAGVLYRVDQGGQARPVTKRRSDARLELAPGGEVFAWVASTGSPKKPAARIELQRTSGERIGAIEIGEAAGPDELILGFQGRLVVTFAPLDDPEGARGRFRYTFWNLDGKRLHSITLDKAIVVLAADGSAVVLLTAKEARAYSAAGEALWGVPGSFRKGALSTGAQRAVLNPAGRDSLDAVVVVERGEVSHRLRLPTAVHHLAISPVGDLVAAAGDRGRYFVLERNRWREGRALDAKLGTPYIFDLGLAGRDAILLGVLYKQAKQHPSWPAGSILGVTRGGALVFRHDFAIREATGFVPGIDVTWGDLAFVGYTREAAILGRLDGGR